jgi:O-antigen/teichoic acid export membrane protein
MPARNPNVIDPPARASYRSGFLFGVLSFLAIACVGLVSTIVTARVYGVRVIGEFALVSVPIAVLWVLSTVKEQQALIREIACLPARHPRVSQLFAVVFTFSSVLTIGMAAVVGAVCLLVFPGPLKAPGLVAPALVGVAGYTFVTNTCWNMDSILSAFVAGSAIFRVRVHEVLSFLAIAVVAGLRWHSVWGLVIATIGGSLTSLVHRVFAIRPFVSARLSWKQYREGFSVLPELLSFGLRATPGQIAQGVAQQGGVWALGMVAPVAVVGAFSRAQTIPQRLQQASMRISEVLYPTLVGRRAQGDARGFDRALIDSIRYEVIGLLLIAAAVGGASHSVLDLFGSGFERASPALVLLMLFPALASVTGTQTQALWAMGRPGWTSVTALARLFVTLVLLVLLTPKIAITGPAIALLAGYVVVIALSGIALRPALELPSRVTWPWRERLSLLVAYAAGFAAAHVLELVVRSPAALPLCLMAGALGYAVALLATGAVNARDRGRIEHASRAISARLRRTTQRSSAEQRSPAPDDVQRVSAEARV